MTEFGERFSNTVSALLRAVDGEHQSINRAAVLMSQAIADDKLVHVIGTGGHTEYRMGGGGGGSFHHNPLHGMHMPANPAEIKVCATISAITGRPRSPERT